MDYPKIKKTDYTPDGSKLEQLEKMFTAAKESRKHMVSRWRRNEELMNGDLLKPYNLPKYKSKIEPNICHSIVQTMISLLTDRDGVVDLMPRTEKQVLKAKEAQDALNYIMDKKKSKSAIRNMKYDSLVYGNGFVKVCIIDDEIEFINIDPFTIFIDSLATNMRDAKCVILCTPTYVDDIEEKYGKRVQPQGVLNEYRSFVKTSDDKYATDRVTTNDLVGQGPNEPINDASYKGGMAILKEAWYYEGGELRLSTWCDNTLLQDIPSPYPFIPIINYTNYDTGHSIWGKGEPEIIGSLATSTAVILSQSLDNLLIVGNSPMVMSKSLAKTQGNLPTDRPGQIFYLNSPADIVQRIPAGNISSSSLPLSEYMMSLIDTTSGVHEISRGFNPTGVSAGKAIEALQQASQTQIRAKEREIGSGAIVDMYRMTLYLMKHNYSKDINIRKRSEDGSGWDFVKIHPYKLDHELDISYVPGSSMPESRASRFDQAVELLQLGLLDEQSFWEWTQKDTTNERLEEIAKAKAEQAKQIQQEMDIINNSTSEDEIMDALLRQREISGMGPKTDNMKQNNPIGDM